MSLLNFPDEKILEICRKLDDKSLWELIQSHGKFYQVCSEIMDTRRSEYIDELIDDFSNELSGMWQTHFKWQEQLPGGAIRYREVPSLVRVITSIPGKIIVAQTTQTPNLMKGMTIDNKGNKGIIMNKSLSSLLYVNDRLLDQKYVHQKSLK